MNGIEKITARIRADAEAECAAIRAESEERCAAIRAENERAAQEEYWRLVREGVKDTEQRVQRLGRTARLEAKKSELEGIEAETAPLVAQYEAEAERAKAKIDERLLVAYERIRRNVRNGLAVVTVKRDACGGCFNRIPPQRQVEIRQGKKIIICEYCGRILVADPEQAEE